MYKIEYTREFQKEEPLQQSSGCCGGSFFVYEELIIH